MDIKRTIQVVLADDHEAVRAAIRTILDRVDGFEVIGEAATGKEAIKLTLALEPDVLLLDVEMPDMDGLGVINRLREAGCRTQILALSGHDDREYNQGLLNETFSGYLVKGESPERIITAVRSLGEVKAERPTRASLN